MNSFFDMPAMDKNAKKQRRQLIRDPKKLPSFSYIPDMGKGIYLLGQKPESDNQVWHMPTAAPLAGAGFVELAANIYGVDPKYMSLKKFVMQLYGLFNKPGHGTVEMYYQYNHDYSFAPAKFWKAFSLQPT